MITTIVGWNFEFMGLRSEQKSGDKLAASTHFRSQNGAESRDGVQYMMYLCHDCVCG